MSSKIGVLVVDDSPLCRKLISDALTKDPSIEVVGTAENGEEAIAKAAELKPAVITMDVDMPVLDGLTATERIMAQQPTPILVLTADPRNQAPELTHRALAVGALALQVKPALDGSAEAWNLAREVRLLSTVKVIRHLRGTRKTSPVVVAPPVGGASSAVGVIVIASSTGGPQVVHKLLSELPAEFPVPIAIVQHINADFAESLVGWLSASSPMKVRLARDGDALAPGVALLAPANVHLRVATRGRVEVKEGPPRDGHVPSGSELLESAAKTYGRRTVGLIFTGMGADGVAGLAAIRAVGGKTIAQSQESSAVFGMPGTAISRGIVDHIVHGDEMAQALMTLVRGEALARGG